MYAVVAPEGADQLNDPLTLRDLATLPEAPSSTRPFLRLQWESRWAKMSSLFRIAQQWANSMKILGIAQLPRRINFSHKISRGFGPAHLRAQTVASISSKTAHSAREQVRARRNHEGFQALVDDRVMSLLEFSEVAGVSVATLRRQIKAGRGPRVTWVSSRRCGIRVRHGREWLDALKSETA